MRQAKARGAGVEASMPTIVRPSSLTALADPGRCPAGVFGENLQPRGRGPAEGGDPFGGGAEADDSGSIARHRFGATVELTTSHIAKGNEGLRGEG